MLPLDDRNTWTEGAKSNKRMAKTKVEEEQDKDE